MYTKHKIKKNKPMSKVQAIRWLKQSKKKLKKWANKPKEVEWIATGMHKMCAVETYKLGIYTPRYIDKNDLLNAGHYLTERCEEYHEFESANSYGVCDSVNNFLSVFDEELKEIPEKVFVLLTPIYRENQPMYSGWRWHKWGNYIGRHIQQHEYLYDEDIEVVWLYHIYVIK